MAAIGVEIHVANGRSHAESYKISSKFHIWLTQQQQITNKQINNNNKNNNT